MEVSDWLLLRRFVAKAECQLVEEVAVVKLNLVLVTNWVLRLQSVLLAASLIILLRVKLYSK